MLNEEVENSLRDHLNRHLDERLNSIKEDLTRAQQQLADALKNIENRHTTAAPDTSLSLALAAHIQQAYQAGMSEAQQQFGNRNHPSSDVALLKAAIDDIDQRRTQSEILDALVNRAASFAPRVVFFVVKNEQAMGWRARGLEGTVGDASVRDISISLAQETLLSEAVHTRQTLSTDADNTRPTDAEIYEKLGGEQSRRMIAVPLVARNRAVAVLYADSGTLDGNALNLEALEAIVSVAGMAVELLATQRPAPSEQSHIPEPRAFDYKSAAPQFSYQSTSQHTSQSAAQSSNEFADAQPQVAQVAESLAPPAMNESSFATSGQTSSASTAEAMQSMSPDAPFDEPARFAAQPDALPQNSLPDDSSNATDVSPDAPSESETSFTYAAPLGNARRYGNSSNELPVEVESEEEQRLHSDARRFARLLVSEIKLYNEQKVREGREQGDLYDRLREEVDRSREMYDKRVAPPVVTRYDYFHHELVSTLAEGDANKLGASYAGTSMAQ